MRTLYYNGDILTMENTDFEAIYIEDGIIKKCGDFKQLKYSIPDDTELIDLHGKCLMPAFIDSHSHIVSLAKTLNLVDLSNSTSIKEIIEQFNNFINITKPKENKLLIGFGYDHNFLKEQRHPLAKELDQIPYPVMISHTSGHMGVINHKAMQLFKLDNNVSDPNGGKYGRDENNQLNGYLEEQAFIDFAGKSSTSGDLKKQLIEALGIYASYGITTVQEGFMKKEEFILLDSLAKENKLYLDVIGYIDIKDNQKLYQDNPSYHQYQNHFKLGGYKLFLDGSPQGKTAWISKPYLDSGDYCGYPIYQDKEVKKYVDSALQEQVQLLTHCNGDMAAKQLLDVFKQKATNTRPVMIHCQILQPEQLPQLKRIGMIPSFFVNHIYYWGDIHLKNLGKRANQISCIHSALKQELPYTFHQDSPVILPNMLESVWCACKRETKAGLILGENEQISVYNALKGVTINAAYQYFEEKYKGSIKEGKIADLIILDKNPCKIAINDILKINILTTIKDGKVVYNKKL
ncbi:amidohydrolase [Thomasclavelia cocleata]|uniref:amidohydrolase n=1 Tax=Thomasclavelia cocleata TaxID=69824 RepID=UPI00241F18A5|nr:amidohydrolase family protein [Thomasclavelia cocleata]